MVRIFNVFMECKMPIFLSSSCFGILKEYAPKIRNIRFSGLTVQAQHNIVVQANEDCLVENIMFRDMVMEMVGIPECADKYGYGEWDYVTSHAAFYFANVKDTLLDGIRVQIMEEESPITIAAIEENAQVDYGTFAVRKAGKYLQNKER